LEFEGFQGGISYHDNTTKQYVAFGSSCDPRYKYMPCYIVKSDDGDRCNVLCDKEFSVKNQIFYLELHSKLKWITTDVNSMLNIKGILKITGGGYPLMFGRVFYEGNYRLGMIHAIDEPYSFKFQGPDGLLSYTQGFEILTCS
jgi:hypothetical protein